MGGTIGIVLVGVLVASLLAATVTAAVPLASVYAQSFYVTTNKGFYYEGERVVVAGTVSDSRDRRPVVVTITSGEDVCTKQNVRPLLDGSFVSRPMIISGCGFGEFGVNASHAGATASSSFTVEGKHDIDDNVELRAVRSTVNQAQNIVNAKMLEILDTNLAMPERAVVAYSKGVAAASLALQAVERGNINAALEHRKVAFDHLSEAYHLLSPEIMNAMAQETRARENRISAASEWFSRLQDLLSRLVDLAEKNSISAEQEFGQIESFLAEARQLIGERRIERAEELLNMADGLLEEVRNKLIQQTEAASEEDSKAHALSLAAQRLERYAQSLREDARGVPHAILKVNASFVYLNSARSSLAEDDYDSTRNSLELALKMLDDAKQIIDDRRRG